MNSPTTLATTHGLHPRVIDSGDGIPLLLLHGAESAANQYDDLLPALSPRIRAIAFDQRDTAETGDGSGGLGAPYRMTDLADDAAAVLDALDIDSAHILGTSFGGAVAQHLAIRHPNRVRSLILMSTTAEAAPVEAYITRMHGLSADLRLQISIEGALSSTGQADPALVERVKGSLAPRSADQRSRRTAALATHDTTQQLAAIKVPTLVIHGNDDTVIPPSCAHVLAAHIPNALLQTIPRGRHALAFEYRTETAQLVNDFVLK